MEKSLLFKNCDICGKKFQKDFRISVVRFSKQKLCSLKCSAQKKSEVANAGLSAKDVTAKKKRIAYNARKKWAESHPEYKKEYYQKNKNQIKIKHKTYREANKEKVRETHKNWVEKNKERRRAIAREWARKNKDNVSENTRRRRLRIRGVSVVAFSKKDLLLRLSMFGGCWICGRIAEEIDHVKPIAKGGIHILSNLRPICRYCNRSKGSKWGVDIYKKIHSIK